MVAGRECGLAQGIPARQIRLAGTYWDVHLEGTRCVHGADMSARL